MRVAIMGSAGSGKTTLARRVAAKTGAEHVEIDALYHQPGWQPQDRDILRAELAERLDAPEWVCDGNYESMIGDIVRGRADTIVFLDLPRHVLMRQIIGRTVRRAVTREELWNGNREPLSNFTSWDPEKNVIRWSWVHHGKYRAHAERNMADGSWDHAEVVIARSRREINEWLATVG